jgi:hypothetical protein
MTDDEMGPVDYVVVEFPGNKMTGEGFPLLLDLDARGIIRILGLLFVRKELDGSLSALKFSDLDADGQADFAMFAGASSELLADADIAEAASVVQPGSAAGILIFENAWAGPFVSALRHQGADVVASGRIPAQDVIEALDALESHPVG